MEIRPPSVSSFSIQLFQWCDPQKTWAAHVHHWRKRVNHGVPHWFYISSLEETQRSNRPQDFDDCRMSLLGNVPWFNCRLVLAICTLLAVIVIWSLHWFKVGFKCASARFKHVSTLRLEVLQDNCIPEDQIRKFADIGGIDDGTYHQVKILPPSWSSHCCMSLAKKCATWFSSGSSWPWKESAGVAGLRSRLLCKPEWAGDLTGWITTAISF